MADEAKYHQCPEHGRCVAVSPRMYQLLGIAWVLSMTLLIAFSLWITISQIDHDRGIKGHPHIMDRIERLEKQLADEKR